MDFIPLDYDYFDFEGRNYVKVFGRNSDGKRVCVIDDCPVYLWAILEEGLSEKKIDKLVEKIGKIELDVKSRKTRVEKVEVVDKNFLGKKVQALKIHATNYKDLRDVAGKLDFEEIDKRRGYDLGYITHYIIEKKLNPMTWYKIKGDILANSLAYGGIDMGLDVDFVIDLESKEELKDKDKFISKVLAYDIETDALEIGGGEILMISLVGKNFKKVITWKKSKTDKKYVEFVRDEEELLEKFVEHVRKYSPDFLVGYHSDNFDLPYIKARAEKFKMKLPLGIDDSQPKFSRGISMTAKISGITHIDLLKFIRTAYAQYMQSETLSLNEVAKEFLGDTKKEFKFEHSSKIKDHKWDKYYEYNLHDSILTLGLFDKFWPDLVEFSKVVKEPIFDISRYGLSKQIESYILHNLEKYNEIPERRPGYNEISDRKSRGGVKGAFVYEPKPGLYEDLVMFDFTSMHTSLIISYNISRGTLTENKKNSYESPEIEIDGKNTKFYFSKEPGFFPKLLEEIFLKRKQFKEEYKKNSNVITKARSNAFKVLSASAHGYVGFFGARYYSWESSSSILAFVRKFNQEVMQKIEDLGHNVIMGDTDSVAFTREGKSKTEIKQLLKKLNDELPGVMHLELEDFFNRGIWVTTRSGITGAKKKYAMMDEDGNIKIRGFETVRRDWCKLARVVQDKVIRMILKEGDEKEALVYVKGIVEDLKERKIKEENLTIKTQLKKPISEYKAISPHVIAARRMKELDLPVSEGGLIEYYIAESNTKSKLVRDRVKLIQEKGKYDIPYYVEKQILPAVENIFQVFGVNTKEVFDGKKQESLGKWF